jgi:ribosome-binding protein aMBF1 (putative translation factor)
MSRIRELREERAKTAPAAFTRRALAQRLGVTEDMVRRWEVGGAKPRQRHARALAREFGIGVGELGLEAEDGHEVQSAG